MAVKTKKKAKAKKKTKAKPKFAYAIHPGPGWDEGRIIIVVKGESGFRFVPDYDCCAKSRRPKIVERLNERARVSKKDADKLVAQSML